MRQIVCIAAALIACAATNPRPSAQSYGSCGFIWVGGNDAGDYLYGWANLVIYNPNCAYEYGVEAGVVVQVVSPWGTPSTDGEAVGGEGGDGLIDTWVPLGQGESGFGSVTGWGSVSYFGYPIDWLYDSLTVLVSGPGGGGGGGGEDPPTPPTITFSPDSSVTANYDSGDVIVTAVVSPPGQGWEEQLYWVGEGEATGDPLQRRFSTNSGVGTFGATAVIASQTEASASVKVVPTLVLNPTEITAFVQPEGYVAISAQVFPTGAASVTWEGAGWHWEEGNLIRYVNIDVVGTFPVFARAGESQQQQAVVNVVPRPVQLRLIFDLDWTWNPQNLDAGNDAPLFVPGRDIWPESYTYGLTLLPETVAAGQHFGQIIAVFVDPSNPNQAVPPPAGVDSVQFILEDTTAFKGYATNSGWNDERDDQPDYGLFSYGSNASLPTVTHGFQSSGGATYTYAYLRILDYGGFTRVRAIASNGMEATLELPLDANDNGLPDAGWVADGELVQDAGQASDDDDLAVCLVQAAGCNNANDAAPSGVPNVGLTGDGLTRAEEMRGMLVKGEITPTNPNVKDLFVAARLINEVGTNYQLGYVSSDRGLPMRVHHIRGETEPPGVQPDYVEDRVINAFGRGMAGHIDQRALQILNVALPDITDPATGTLLPVWGYAPQRPETGCMNGGMTPNQNEAILVDVVKHRQQMTMPFGGMPNQSSEVVDRNVQKTMAHEVGHAIHVNHRTQSGALSPAGACSDSASPGSAETVMTSGWFQGLGDNWGATRYNNTDRDQIRLK